MTVSGEGSGKEEMTAGAISNLPTKIRLFKKE